MRGEPEDFSVISSVVLIIILLLLSVLILVAGTVVVGVDIVIVLGVVFDSGVVFCAASVDWVLVGVEDCGGGVVVPWHDESNTTRTSTNGPRGWVGRRPRDDDIVALKI